MVLDVFRDAFHSATELLTHDVGIGVVCGDSEYAWRRRCSVEKLGWPR